MNEHLDVQNLFPEFNRWMAFLEQQDPHLVYRSRPVRKDTEILTTRFQAEGVQNEVYFINSNFPNEMNFRPYLISQEAQLDRYTHITLNLNSGNVSNLLEFRPDSVLLAKLSVGSTSGFTSDQDWRNIQTVFLSITDGYLNQLKEEELLDGGAGNRIWIMRSPEDITQFYDLRRPSGKTSRLGDDTLRRICADVGLEFDLFPGKPRVKGSFNGVRFSVQHTDPLKLDPGKIWDCMTGKPGKHPFIVPVWTK